MSLDNNTGVWTETKQDRVVITLSGEIRQLVSTMYSELNCTGLCSKCHALSQTCNKSTNPPNCQTETPPDHSLLVDSTTVGDAAKICRDFTLDGAVFRFKMYCAHHCPDPKPKVHYELWMLSATPQEARSAWLQRLALQHRTSAEPSSASHTAVHVFFSRPTLSGLGRRYSHHGGGHMAPALAVLLHPVDPDLPPPPKVAAVKTHEGLLVGAMLLDLTESVQGDIIELKNATWTSPRTVTLYLFFHTSTRRPGPAPSGLLQHVAMKVGRTIDVDEAASHTRGRCSVQ